MCDLFLRAEDRITEFVNEEDFYIIAKEGPGNLAPLFPYKIFYPINEEINNTSIKIGDVLTVREAKNYPSHMQNQQTKFDNKVIAKTGIDFNLRTGYSHKSSASGGARSDQTTTLTTKYDSNTFTYLGPSELDGRTKDTGIAEVLLKKLAEKNKYFKNNIYAINFSEDFDPSTLAPDAQLDFDIMLSYNNTGQILASRGIQYKNGDMHFGIDIITLDAAADPANSTIKNPANYAIVTEVVGSSKKYPGNASNNNGYGNHVIVAVFEDQSSLDRHITNPNSSPPSAYIRFQHLKSDSIPVAIVEKAEQYNNQKNVSKLVLGEEIGIIGKTGYSKSTSTGPLAGVHLHIETRDKKSGGRTRMGRNVNIYFMAKSNNQLIGADPSPLTLPLTSILIQYKKISLTEFELKKGGAVDQFSDLNTNTQKMNGVLITSSPLATFPKLKILDFACDLSVNNPLPSQQGVVNIKIREDLRSDLLNIKDILNYFGIPLTLEYFDFSLDTKESYLAKLGLQVNLNRYSSLNVKNNSKFNDYYISPIKNKKIYNNGNYFNVYGKVKSDSKTYKGINAELIELDYYDITNTYNLREPDLKTEKNYYINITNLFYNNGFYPVEPKYGFFKYSKPEDSNWWIFQNYNRLNINTTLEQNLQLIYNKDNNPLWNNSSKILWNGKRFV